MERYENDEVWRRNTAIRPWVVFQVVFVTVAVGTIVWAYCHGCY